jgi:hypothetical protein
MSTQLSVAIANLIPYPQLGAPMFEFLFFFSLIYLFLNRKKRRKKTLDTELKDLLESSSDATGIALDIKNYLLRVLDDDKNDREKFNDNQLAEAQRIFDRAGPSSLFWMTEIAAQMTLLATAQKNGIPTNVDYEVKEGATPEEIIDAVVKI